MMLHTYLCHRNSWIGYNFTITSPLHVIAEPVFFFLAVFMCQQPEHQQLIVDTGALSHLVDLLKRHKDSHITRPLYSAIRRAADAITNLAHENSSIKTRVRFACLSRSPL